MKNGGTSPAASGEISVQLGCRKVKNYIHFLCIIFVDKNAYGNFKHRIKKGLKEKLRDADWRQEIGSFIEAKVREAGILKTLNVINEAPP